MKKILILCLTTLTLLFSLFVPGCSLGERERPEEVAKDVPPAQMEVHFLGVGQADCTLIKTDNMLCSSTQVITRMAIKF